MSKEWTFSPWTALVAVAGIAGVIAMAYLKVDMAAIAAYASAAIGIAASFRQLAYTKPADPTPPAAPKDGAL